MSSGMTGNEYDALGRILSQGGELTIAHGLLHGWTQGRIETTLTKRFGTPSTAVLESAYKLARQGIISGGYLSQLGFQDRVDMGQIVVNPYLWATKERSNRLKIVANIEQLGGLSIVEIRSEWPDIFNTEELVGWFIGKGADIVNKYPEKFGVSSRSNDGGFNVRFVFAERAF